VATLKIEELMTELKDQVTIVMVTHNMQQAARVSDYTAMMMIDDSRAGQLIEYNETKIILPIPVISGPKIMSPAGLVNKDRRAKACRARI